jgi:hypothetical protein
VLGVDVPVVPNAPALGKSLSFTAGRSLGVLAPRQAEESCVAPSRSGTPSALHGRQERSVHYSRRITGKGDQSMVAENRFCRSLAATTQASAPARTLAELLRDLGAVLRWRVRHGAGTDCAPVLPESLRWDSKLALAFVNLRTSVQLRAMVEDWPFQRIQEAVGAHQLERFGPQEGYTIPIGPHRGAKLEDKRAGPRPPGLLTWLIACGFAAVLAAGIIGGHR